MLGVSLDEAWGQQSMTDQFQSHRHHHQRHTNVGTGASEHKRENENGNGNGNGNGLGTYRGFGGGNIVRSTAYESDHHGNNNMNVLPPMLPHDSIQQHQQQQHQHQQHHHQQQYHPQEWQPHIAALQNQVTLLTKMLTQCRHENTHLLQQDHQQDLQHDHLYKKRNSHGHDHGYGHGYGYSGAKKRESSSSSSSPSPLSWWQIVIIGAVVLLLGQVVMNSIQINTKLNALIEIHTNSNVHANVNANANVNHQHQGTSLLDLGL